MDVPSEIQIQTFWRISVCHDTRRTRTNQGHGRQSRKWDLPPSHIAPLSQSSSHDIRYQGLLAMDTLRSVEQKLQGLPTLEIQESRWGTLRKTMGLSLCSFESPCVMVQHLDAGNFILKRRSGFPWTGWPAGSTWITRATFSSRGL